MIIRERLLRPNYTLKVSLHEVIYEVNIFEVVLTGRFQDRVDANNVFVLEKTEDFKFPECSLHE